jgi:glycosyltransferase involved in cell wall biosynthesis
MLMGLSWKGIINYGENLGFEKNDIVLISLGAIKRYKLNEKIIKSVIKARKINSKIKLIVIGKGEDDYVDSLRDMVQGDNGVMVVNSFVKNEDIPKYLSMADYSVFYYDQSEMTSGGIILSLSYGVPVISRNIPGAEMVTKKSGYIFSNDTQLVDVISNLEPLGQFGGSKNDIIGTVRDNNWDRTSARLLEIYKNI